MCIRDRVCGVPLNKITYLPQHAEDIYSTYRGQYIDNNCIDFVFAGNIGAVQDIQCIIRACKRIQPTENYCVHLVGDEMCIRDRTKRNRLPRREWNCFAY